MKTMINAFLIIALLAMVVTVPAMAQNDTRVTYIHTDADGTPFAATDEQGNLEWQIEHLPFGGEHRNTEVRRNNNLSFAGKIYDKDIGLSYFGARWYDPASGRFTGIDPMPVNAEDWKTFNRYAYGNNNPYKYVDPDGNLPFLIPIAIFLAKEGLAEVASRYTGGATDLLSVRRMGSRLVKKSFKLLKRNKSGPKCFVAGTPVHTKEGLKSIEDIQIGDYVASKNDETGEIDFKPVTELFVNKDKQVLNITFSDENNQQEVIGTTAEHPFWVEGKGWREAGNLNVGDKITTLKGGVLSVLAMASDAQLQTTYNFEVEEFHTYFVGKRALWVHNECDGDAPRGEFKVDDFVGADAMGPKQYRKLVKNISEIGLKNKQAEFVVKEEVPHVTYGSNRLAAAKQLGIADQIKFVEKTVPTRGFQTLDDVVRVPPPKFRGPPIKMKSK